MIHRLAIIIPAYKATFLPAALDSIAMQTCKDFTLYVGDDCSPEPIGSIVEQYRDKIDLVYQRFDTNLGSKDLVAQWERCIAMSRDEPYIWLFSDDDVMEPNCVATVEQKQRALKLKLLRGWDPRPGGSVCGSQRLVAPQHSRGPALSLCPASKGWDGCMPRGGGGSFTWFHSTSPL